MRLAKPPGINLLRAAQLRHRGGKVWPDARPNLFPTVNARYGHGGRTPGILAAMSKTPNDLDAILESIRQRVGGEEAPAPPPLTLAEKPQRLAPAPIIDAKGTTVEALFTSVLEPLLRQWIDANMPEICERAAQEEIRRLTGRG